MLYVDSISETVDQQTDLDAVSPTSAGLIVPPVSQSVTLYVPEESDTSAEAAITTDSAAPDVDSIDQMELREPAASAPAVSPDIIDTVFHNASLASRENDVETIELGDSYQSASADSSSNAMWNAVFVVGLLFAMGLIVVGWLKTRQEREMEREMELQMADAARITPTPDDSATPESELESESESVEQDELVADVELSQTPEVAAEVVTVDESIADNAEISGDCPILSAGIEDRWEEQSESSLETVAESIEVESVRSETGEWSAADWQEFETGKATAEEEPANGSDILEELIQNRLPIQLQQAELPLQIALFGEPAGPQRLRVDAAHTKLAAPHMAKVARRSKQKMPVASVESTAGNEAKTRATEKTVRSPAAQSDDGSRFDHALNFHEEQSDK